MIASNSFTSVMIHIFNFLMIPITWLIVQCYNLNKSAELSPRTQKTCCYRLVRKLQSTFLYSAFIVGSLETCLEFIFGSINEIMYFPIWDFLKMPVSNQVSFLIAHFFLLQYVLLIKLIYDKIVCQLDPIYHRPTESILPNNK